MSSNIRVTRILTRQYRRLFGGVLSGSVARVVRGPPPHLATRDPGVINPANSLEKNGFGVFSPATKPSVLDNCCSVCSSPLTDRAGGQVSSAANGCSKHEVL